MITKAASICIATFRRPAGLTRLLTSIARQEDAPSFEVIVVDNDRDQSAAQAVSQFSALPVTYLVEPMRGLAQGRNRAVAAATSPYIAFIDDDEAASPGWLAELDRVARTTDADVVIGPVSMIFDARVPDYIRTCSVFGEDRLLRDGAAVPWYWTRTSNAYVKRQSIPDLPTPFATRLDFVGGEDVDLFKRMSDAGSRIVAAERATVVEYRPAHRATLRWVIRRAVRNGGTVAALSWQSADFTARLKRDFRSGAIGARQAVAAMVRWNRDRQAAMRNLIRACEEVGKMMHDFGFSVDEYRNPS